jgi:excisionase family DNA binding protein
VRERVLDEGFIAIDADRAARSAVRTAITATDQLGLGDAADARRDDVARSATASGPRLLLTVREAAHALGVGRSTVYELINAGELEVVHIGRACRVPVAVVEAYVERLRQPPDSTRLAVRARP